MGGKLRIVCPAFGRLDLTLTSDIFAFIEQLFKSRTYSSASAMDLLQGKNLVKADGSKVDADTVLGTKKVICFYFSAHWCPPCRAFTPVLKDFYEVRSGYSLRRSKRRL